MNFSYIDTANVLDDQELLFNCLIEVRIIAIL